MLKKGLGRGLSALIPDVPATKDSPALEVDVGTISPSPFQPRRSFDDATLEELATSIREKGILQPLLVRRKNGYGYELVAGERRLRAAIRAGLNKVPVVVRDATDNEALQLALIENIQREDLNPVEEAGAFQRLQEEFQWSQEEIASRVGKSRPAIANSMRLLLLPKELQQEIAQGRLPAGQARALLGLQREALILSAAREAIAKGLSTRETERLVQRLKTGPRKRREASSLDPDLRSLTERLQRSLGTKVRIVHRGKSARGRIEIDYYSVADLDRIVQAMTAQLSVQ
jgi:ParB family chromosome partitioning protein